MTLKADEATTSNGDAVAPHFSIEDGKIYQTIRIGEKSLTSERTRPSPSRFSFQESPRDEWWRSYLEGNPCVPQKRTGLLSFVDLFTSAGGLSLALKEAALSLGLRVESMFCADMDERALEVYERRLNPLFKHVGDIDNLVDVDYLLGLDGVENSLSRILLDDKLRRIVGEVDVVIAGPPCQGHSSLNNSSRYEDPRNRLFMHPVAIGIALQAKAIVIENVPGVRKDTSAVVDRACLLLKQYGYKFTDDVLKAEHFGWPQTRHRYFLIAVRGEICESLETFREQLQHPGLPLEWAIADLLDVKGEDVMTQSASMSAENQERIQWLIENDEIDLPDDLRPACHRDKPHTYGTVYGRLQWGKPAGTITTGFATPGRGRYIHPELPRTLLPIEAARIQGFPDGYFSDLRLSRPIRRSEIVKWIGDAVPAPLGHPAMLCAMTAMVKNGLLSLNA